MVIIVKNMDINPILFVNKLPNSLLVLWDALLRGPVYFTHIHKLDHSHEVWFKGYPQLGCCGWITCLLNLLWKSLHLWKTPYVPCWASLFSEGVEMPSYGHSSLELVIFLARSIAQKNDIIPTITQWGKRICVCIRLTRWRTSRTRLHGSDSLWQPR